MKKNTNNDIKLGIFISAGLLVLIISLYVIGSKQNFFGSNFYVRARFANAGGLVPGNNVLYSGIQAGTVSDIEIIDDTTIEVTLLLNKKIKPYIYSNSLVSIGNDGLMGNKIINITPNSTPASHIEDNGLLMTQSGSNMDQMMQTLSYTNENAMAITSELKETTTRINNDNTLWTILDDTMVAKDLIASVANLRASTARINEMTTTLDLILKDIHQGKGTIGTLLTDDDIANDIQQAVQDIDRVAVSAEVAIRTLDSTVQQLRTGMTTGGSMAHTVIGDTAAANSLKRSLQHIEKGTDRFSESMEALQHNFLLRRYFKRKARNEKGKE